MVNVPEPFEKNYIVWKAYPWLMIEAWDYRFEKNYIVWKETETLTVFPIFTVV